jgi:hypothetical protein
MNDVLKETPEEIAISHTRYSPPFPFSVSCTIDPDLAYFVIPRSIVFSEVI